MAQSYLILLPLVMCGFLSSCERHEPPRADLTVKVEQGFEDKDVYVENGCNPPSDLRVAHVRDGDKLLDSIKHCAAYGKSSAEAFTDRSGRNYVLIQRDTVHASSL